MLGNLLLGCELFTTVTAGLCFVSIPLVPLQLCVDNLHVANSTLCAVENIHMLCKYLQKGYSAGEKID